MTPPDIEDHLTSAVVTLQSLFSQEQFTLPDIQRNYAWKKPLVQGFWDDLVEQFGNDDANSPFYYLGTMVFWKPPNEEATDRKWRIIDGQQRFTTITLLYAALRDYLTWIRKKREFLSQIQEQEPREFVWEYLHFRAQTEDSEEWVLHPIDQENFSWADLPNEVEDEVEHEFTEEDEPIEDEIWESNSRFQKSEFAVNWRKISDDGQSLEGGPIQYPPIGEPDFQFQENHLLHGNTISSLSDFIHRNLVFRPNSTGTELIPIMELKGKDKERLQYLQNRIYDDQNHDMPDHTRESPPGQIQWHDHGPEKGRKLGGTKIYLAYDHLIEMIDQKFKSFGDTYVPCDENGDPYFKTQDLKPTIIHTDEQLSEAILFLQTIFQLSQHNLIMTSTPFKTLPMAYQAFVNINSKVESLSLAEIVRAMILAKMEILGYREGSEEYNGVRNNLNAISETLSNSTQQDTFIRAHWISRNSKKKSKTAIAAYYQEILKPITAGYNNPETGEDGVAFLTRITSEMASDIPYFMQAIEPQEEGPADQFIRLRRTFLDARIRQHLPMVMSALRRGWNQENNLGRIHLVAECTILFNNWLGGNPSLAEDSFAVACKHINDDGIDADQASAAISQEILANVFPTSSYQEMKEKVASLKSNNEISVWHYILRKMEISLQQEQVVNALAELQGIEVSVNPELGTPTEVNLEHIMPETRGEVEYWQDITDSQHEQNLWRIGNLTLLNKTLNQEISNSGFDIKLQAYGPREAVPDEVPDPLEGETHSNVILTNELLEYDEWGIENIEDRSQKLAARVMEIWDALPFPEIEDEPEVQQDGAAEAGEGPQEDDQDVGAEGDAAVQEALENDPADQEE